MVWAGVKSLLSFRSTPLPKLCHHRHVALKLAVLVSSRLAGRWGAWKFASSEAWKWLIPFTCIFHGLELITGPHVNKLQWRLLMGISCALREKNKTTRTLVKIEQSLVSSIIALKRMFLLLWPLSLIYFVCPEKIHAFIYQFIHDTHIC